MDATRSVIRRMLTEAEYAISIPKSFKYQEDMEALFNPEFSDWEPMLRDTDVVRALLYPNGNWVIWEAHGALHRNVRRVIPEWSSEGEEPIPVNIWGNPGQPGTVVDVTDASNGTRWHHNPETAQAIRDHVRLRQTFPDFEVTYYDDAIVGDWEELE